MTIDAEEWYHSRWFDVHRLTRDPPSLLDQDLDLVLALLRKLSINATFFVLGQMAEKSPQLVERIKKDGHEVACHGYSHNSIMELGREHFERELKRARESISRALREAPSGYRSPNFRISTEAINILEDLGFCYDSSLVPCLGIPGWYGHPEAPISPFRPSRGNMCKEDAQRGFWEVPVSTFPVLRFPGAGGWYVRNLGWWWTRALLRAQLRRGPATVYFHTWEISGNVPDLHGIPFHVRRRIGRYTKHAITSLTKELGGRVLSIRDYLESFSR
jgi:polysaccharide deacetylase family protein (PEP-CTERM system associated)